MATATFNAIIESEAAESGDVGSVPRRVALWDDDSRTNFIAEFVVKKAGSNPLADLDALALGQTIRFAANDLVFTLINDSSAAVRLSNFGLVEALRGIFRTNRYATWHTGATSSGTANRINGIAPTLLPVGNITYAQ